MSTLTTCWKEPCSLAGYGGNDAGSGIPLYALESRRPVRDFDVVGFSLQYELSFTNVLNMLDLAVSPFGQSSAVNRSSGNGRGPVCFNPEPMAPFIDVFLIGDGEELLPEFLARLQESRGKKRRSSC